MKTSISLLFAAAALVVAIPQTAQAGTHLENRGRAGYAVVRDREPAAAITRPDDRRETNVALVMEKPGADRPVLMNMGRAGYHYVYRQDQGR